MLLNEHCHLLIVCRRSGCLFLLVEQQQRARAALGTGGEGGEGGGEGGEGGAEGGAHPVQTIPPFEQYASPQPQYPNWEQHCVHPGSLEQLMQADGQPALATLATQKQSSSRQTPRRPIAALFRL